MKEIRTAKFLDDYFSLDREGKDDKVMSLQDAVKRFISPGMTLHLAFPTYHRANAIVREVIKQYWGKKPNFTLMCVGIGVQNFGHVFFHGGLIRKAISTFYADAYPTPGPNPILQEAYLQGNIQFEHWSILSYTSRLLAGAMGIGFMPTKSIIGSSMANENSDSFKIIEDPFSPKMKRGIVKAINPDISLVHGLAADRHGNTILAPPYSENIYGVFASRRGALVTVEKIVPTEFIRRYSHMVRIPSNVVRSVSLVPWGAHPLGVSSAGVSEIEVYAEDYDFLEIARKVCHDKTQLEEWIEKWILGCSDQDEYLHRLGKEKILNLKGKTYPDSWRFELGRLKKTSKNSDYNASEMMVVAMARCLIEKILASEYTTILAGIGQANLAAWLANYHLKMRDYPVNLIAEIGMFGYAPRPGDPFIFNHANIPTAKMLTDSFQALGIMVAGEMNRCIGAMGTAQVDKKGNLNSTLIHPNTLISGSGGGNDTASGSKEIVVSVFHSPERTVERVSYITCPGNRVKTLVTNLGIFEKMGEEKVFTLKELLPSVRKLSIKERVEEIKQKTGWKVKVHPNIRFMESPKIEELHMLRLFDPHRHFIGE